MRSRAGHRLLRILCLAVPLGIAGCEVPIPMDFAPVALPRCPSPDARIPDDVPGDIRCEWVERRVPDAGYFEVTGWLNVIARDSQPTTVEIDWLRVHALLGGRDTVVWSTDFDPPSPQVNGGTYPRNPWLGGTYPPSGYQELPHEFDPAGYLVLHPDSRYSRVFQVRNGPGPRHQVPRGASAFWSEARMRITGPACAQVGYEFWQSLIVVRCETGALSDWAFESAAWETLRVPAVRP